MSFLIVVHWLSPKGLLDIFFRIYWLLIKKNDELIEIWSMSELKELRSLLYLCCKELPWFEVDFKE